MSIALSSESITEETETKIINEVFVKKVEGNNFAGGKFNKFKKAPEKIVQPFRLSDNKTKAYIPFDWALQNIPNTKRPLREQFISINTKFNTTLRDTQKEVKDDCISSLNKRGSILISLYAGCGKTALAIYLASRIGLKTLIFKI